MVIEFVKFVQYETHIMDHRTGSNNCYAFTATDGWCKGLFNKHLETGELKCQKQNFSAKKISTLNP